jgi:hypothetical protein
MLRASEGTLSSWSRLYLQSLASSNQHWVRVADYGPFSLWVIHKEGLRLSSGDINRLMMNVTMVRRPVEKIIAESLSHDEKHVVPTPLSKIREEKKVL